MQPLTAKTNLELLQADSNPKHYRVSKKGELVKLTHWYQHVIRFFHNILGNFLNKRVLKLCSKRISLLKLGHIDNQVRKIYNLSGKFLGLKKLKKAEFTDVKITLALQHLKKDDFDSIINPKPAPVSNPPKPAPVSTPPKKEEVLSLDKLEEEMKDLDTREKLFEQKGKFIKNLVKYTKQFSVKEIAEKATAILTAKQLRFPGGIEDAMNQKIEKLKQKKEAAEAELEQKRQADEAATVGLLKTENLQKLEQAVVILESMIVNGDIDFIEKSTLIDDAWELIRQVPQGMELPDTLAARFIDFINGVNEMGRIILVGPAIDAKNQFAQDWENITTHLGIEAPFKMKMQKNTDAAQVPLFELLLSNVYNENQAKEFLFEIRALEKSDDELQEDFNRYLDNNPQAHKPRAEERFALLISQ